MKILIPLSLLIVGLAIGYAVGINSGKVSKDEYFITDSIPSVSTIVYDTIIKTKIIEVEKKTVLKSQTDTLTVDSLDQNLVVVDTLKDNAKEVKDSVIDENLSIVSDVRLKLINLPVIHLLNTLDDSDSLLKSAIDINDVDKKYINVEFWESPISFSGYKLSKSKLIIYGLSPQLDYQIYKRNESYYLIFHSITYELFETEEFRQFVETFNPIK